MLIRFRLRRNPDSPAEDREFRLDALRMGQAPSADFVIPDDSAQAVSWQHARIDCSDSGAVLHDLKSTNGTYLNGRKIDRPENLRVGDRIQFGQTGPILELVLLSASPSPAPYQPQSAPQAAYDRPRPQSPPPPLRGSAQPAQISATRALLVGMQKKQQKWMIFGIGGLAVAGLVIGIMLIRHEGRLDDLDEQVAKINSKFIDFETDLETIKAKQAEIDQSTQTFYADTDALDKAVASGKANSETIYQRAVRSTAWVISDRGGDGSGSVIEHEGKLLIVTSYHVIHGARNIGVRFPETLDGKVLASPTQYIRDDAPSRKESTACTLWASDPEVDLAILEPVGLPKEIRPLKLGDKSPNPGADVHTVGSDPSESNARWTYTNGKVRQIAGPMDMRTRTGRTVRAKIVQTQNPVNRGDSGGPLVNQKCELVGVTFGGVDGSNLVTQFIDAGHVKDVLKNRPKKTQPSPAPPPPPKHNPPPSSSGVSPSAAAGGRVHALFVIDDTDPNIADGCRRDGQNMNSLFSSGLPAGSFGIEWLRNRAANAAGISSYYNGLRGNVAPGDTVFCYYTGHGCTERGTRAHYLAMQKGKSCMARAELLSVMQSMGGKLTVLITDCCSSWSGGSNRDVQTTTEFSRVQVLGPLLLRHQGVVDWQAASPGYPASGPRSGGLFTTSFCNAASSGTHQTWQPLFSDVQSRTQRISRGNPRQTPYQFETTNVRRE